MAHPSPEPTTVVFACARAERAQLAAALCNELLDPRLARAFAHAPPAAAPPDLLIVLASQDLASPDARLPPCGARELWPLLDPRHTDDLAPEALRRRLRQHVLALLTRRGWSPSR